MRLMLVDGNNLGYRAFKRTDLSHEGQGTEVVYIGLRSLVRVVKKFKPDELLVTWDGGHDKRRKDLFKGYKEKGELTPEELEEKKEFFRQLTGLTKVFHAMGVRQVAISGREADDVIASIVREPVKCGFGKPDDVVIVSTDKDYYQLLDLDGLMLYSPITDELLTRELAEMKLGFPVEGYPFFKAVTGGHDKIPGLEGVGGVTAKFLTRAVYLALGEEPKTARETKSLALLVEHADDVQLWTDISKFLPIEAEEIMENVSSPERMPFNERLRVACQALSEFGIEEVKDELDEFVKLFTK